MRVHPWYHDSMRTLSIIVIIAAVLGIGYWLEQQWSTTAEEPEFKTYLNGEAGISFRYPAYYYLEERMPNGRTEAILTEDTEENRLLREGKLPGREGPVSITAGFASSSPASLESWVRENSFMNFQLATTEFASTTVTGEPAIAYSSTGLYEADAVVTQKNGNVFYFSVTYIMPNDRIRSDFEELLETILLTAKE